MIKIIAIALPILLILSACGSQQDVFMPPTSARAADVQLILAVDLSLEPVFFSAAEDFAARASAISDGELSIHVEWLYNPSQALEHGDIQMAFLKSDDQSLPDIYFEAVSMPFLYSNYSHFTNIINNTRILNMITHGSLDSIEARPIAGFYRPANRLVTIWPLEEYHFLSEAMIALNPQSRSSDALQAIGATILPIYSPQERAELIMSGDIQGAEFTLAELLDIQWIGQELHVTDIGHDLSPVWLFADDDTLRSLTPLQRAYITESSAYLFNTIDGSFLAEDRRYRTSLEGYNFLFTGYFAPIRLEMLHRLESMPEYLVSSAQRFMLEVVN